MIALILITKIKRKKIVITLVEDFSKSNRSFSFLFKVKNFLFSAHRAGALKNTFTEMGEIVLEDMKLISKNLPPRLCKRAERETVKLIRSKPVAIN